MITISLCMIVKNEEAVLERCLESVRDAVDEIVIVDTGSTDRTVEIARRWTDAVYHFDWIEDFAAARNASFAYATQSHILWLDADDRLLEKDRLALLQLKKSLDPNVDAVSMLYHCDFDSAGNVTLAVRRARLVKRSRDIRWEGVVHEDLIISGACIDGDIVVTHGKLKEGSDSGRNLRIYAKLLESGGTMGARDLLHYGMELHQHRRYAEAHEIYSKFRSLPSTKGEEHIFVCIRQADCYYHLGDRDKELLATFQAFQYDTPRPESCCRLGYYFMEQGRYAQAIYWYKEALDAPIPENRWAIRNEVSRTWLPHMHLGNCYAQLMEYDTAFEHYFKASAACPGNAYLEERVEETARLVRQQSARSASS
ncbi:glycosyl transferase [Cohnella sp. CIP 111063]|uniref:glycosyltransferase n=1 Tax=unclassified Cohnella TaxID=2636738 RepID=UPI000B8C0E04|nr:MULTISPECIES: glycosyltransferase [unclassified Cohnella]OXS62677.1 glycosyl transferase [Cohnella sp. CIP 111063]PRX74943.1 glycosyl transferase family 2 [Cohnella sp. SGD-V74]